MQHYTSDASSDYNVELNSQFSKKTLMILNSNHA